MGLIDEKIKTQRFQQGPKSGEKTKTKYRKFPQSVEDVLSLLWAGINCDKKISEELNRTEKSIRIKLWFLDLIGEEDVNWLGKPQQKAYPNETQKKQTNKMDRRRETKIEKSV